VFVLVGCNEIMQTDCGSLDEQRVHFLFPHATAARLFSAFLFMNHVEEICDGVFQTRPVIEGSDGGLEADS